MWWPEEEEEEGGAAGSDDDDDEDFVLGSRGDVEFAGVGERIKI